MHQNVTFRYFFPFLKQFSNNQIRSKWVCGTIFSTLVQKFSLFCEGACHSSQKSNSGDVGTYLVSIFKRDSKLNIGTEINISLKICGVVTTPVVSFVTKMASLDKGFICTLFALIIIPFNSY